MLEEAKEFLKTRKKMNLTMVMINIVVFLVLEILGNTESSRFMVEHGAMFPPLVLEQGEWYRLGSSMFLHFGLEHLAYNMLLLIIAGDILETQIGALRYLLIYLGGGLAGNLLSLYRSTLLLEQHVSAGASGAIFAVVGALVWLAFLHREQLGDDYVKRVAAVAFLTLIDGFWQSGVDNYAHMGGFAGGLVLCMILNLLKRKK